jgi:hemin uptake protein HemP
MHSDYTRCPNERMDIPKVLRERKSAADTVQRAYQPAPRITSKILLGAARELIIEHDGRDYRLRLTQQGKLILTA